MEQNLSYPIGKFEAVPFSETLKKEWLLDIEALPNLLEAAVANLDEAQLQTPYRPGGWTVHQLVHHVADSHANAYIRFKLGLTEEVPTIKPYDQAAWANLQDTVQLPINLSLTLLHALHRRLYAVLAALTQHEWQRKVYHPQQQKELSLWDLLGTYAWHGRHHAAHILALRKRENWN